MNQPHPTTAPTAGHSLLTAFAVFVAACLLLDPLALLELRWRLCSGVVRGHSGEESVSSAESFCVLVPVRSLAQGWATAVRARVGGVSPGRACPEVASRVLQGEGLRGDGVSHRSFLGVLDRFIIEGGGVSPVHRRAVCQWLGVRGVDSATKAPAFKSLAGWWPYANDQPDPSPHAPAEQVYLL